MGGLLIDIYWWPQPLMCVLEEKSKPVSAEANIL